MSQPDFGRHASASGPWPYGSPDQHPGYADPGDSTDPYRHHADAVPDDPVAGDTQQDPGLPPDWPGYGAYTPGPDDQSSRDDPPWPAPPAPPPHGGRRRRSLKRTILLRVLLLAVVTAGAGAALLRTGSIHLTPASHPGASATSGPGATAGTGHNWNGGSRSAAPQPPAISKAEAQRVVTRYWQLNNQANETYSDSLLRRIEAGSSYSMDTGAYRFERGNTAKSPYVAFALTGTRYYIPRLPRGTYPHWFAIRGTFVAPPTDKKLGSTYIVFAQDAPGTAWKNVVEPDILPGQALPQIATGSGGYAVSVTANAGLSVAPGRIGQVTASWLDQIAADPSNTAVLANAGNLTDLKDEVFWRSGEGGAPFNAADSHSAPSDPVFGLKTTDGGALLFYTVAAHLVLTPPDGGTISGLNISGYYSPSSSAGLTSAAVGYIEQFAAYVPASGHSGRRIVADVSSIASRG